MDFWYVRAKQTFYQAKHGSSLQVNSARLINDLTSLANVTNVVSAIHLKPRLPFSRPAASTCVVHRPSLAPCSLAVLES